MKETYLVPLVRASEWFPDRNFCESSKLSGGSLEDTFDDLIDGD